MTSAKQRSIINEIRRLQKEVAELRECRRAALTGAASATLSAGGGSKTYTNWTPAQFDEAITLDLDQISALKRELSGSGQFRIGQVRIVRC